MSRWPSRSSRRSARSPAGRRRPPALLRARVPGRRRQDRIGRPRVAACPGAHAGRRTPARVNDADTTALFADRQARLALLRGEGPRMLNAGNWRRAAELCRAWSDLEFWNAEPWRCLGYALQAQGFHQEAIAAFRRAAAIRSARQQPGCGDRQESARHRRRLPEPLPALTRGSEEQGPRFSGDATASERTGNYSRERRKSGCALKHGASGPSVAFSSERGAGAPL